MSNDDFNAIIGKFLPFAEERLEDLGRFEPYGGTMSNDGEVEMVTIYDGEFTCANISLDSFAKA